MSNMINLMIPREDLEYYHAGNYMFGVTAEELAQYKQAAEEHITEEIAAAKKEAIKDCVDRLSKCQYEEFEDVCNQLMKGERR